MCYNLQYYTRKFQEYAKRLSNLQPDTKLLEIQFQKIAAEITPHYHADAFAHPLLPIIAPDLSLTAAHWGLIPPWIKTRAEAIKFRRQTLNARGESIFEKPAFRQAAQHGRCIILADGFYEYHHLKNKAYPYFITMKNEEPLLIAGLLSRWANPETGEEINTVSMVTTGGNSLLAKIHNNPKGEGHRMPLLLQRGEEILWLKGNVDETKSLMGPKAENLLKAHTVSPLKGKQATGNIPQSCQIHNYGLQELLAITHTV